MGRGRQSAARRCDRERDATPATMRGNGTGSAGAFIRHEAAERSRVLLRSAHAHAPLTRSSKYPATSERSFVGLGEMKSPLAVA